ncbi:type III-B CRISPR module RAMP protein Cmr6 [Truepera radiovictrix]|uniref:CRISPR-associated RAMP protein, Cmr6 family n=1 Tax=Truepera radiovictrix (strain DSM 17093 / CIP 108686 / LMG 22925 / RQ-24) TaxID=649638 RepID=D7CXH2_TRURR|nr:type III-B CRISPR module RAMP protein Cmr6 [Truepera radiovictrix]ADI14574.1 CRISPR-associated RAMP protein, Cmr6 family [Truepera radiovictrix DSM 17093]WMT56876.1 type III-B CRISPR module RAMP protein Cmr6 [Truepera radiovictrix]
MRPLYREARERLERRGGHAGLWYDKFCDKWQSDWSGLGDEGKKDWVTSVTGKPVGDADQLKAHAERMQSFLSALGQAPLLYKLESDFVTGLGREHPVENGFAWHHTLGTPYLPGSSVKGMVRAWAAQWAKESNETLKRIFGSEDIDDKNFQVGSVVFLDAIPTAPVQLKADVMTPHYGPWYRGEAPPADWHSPVPVPFLVVEQEQTFLFGVLPRRNGGQGREDCEAVRGWLKEALCWLGAGAKTAVGYGRFKPVGAKATAASTVQEVQEAATLTPAEELVKGLRQVSNKKLREAAQGFVDKLKRLECSDDEKFAAAKAMQAILEEAKLPKLTKLNAYRELNKLVGE